MDSILTAAAGGMQARMQSLELLANNLANVETGGYKADREEFSVFTSSDASVDPWTGDAAVLPLVESRWTDSSQGGFRDTANPLDLAIEGPGLFSIRTPQGVRYTRNGTFRIGAGGTLAASDGNPVLGEDGGTISLQPGVPVHIQSEGSVLQGGVPVGRIALVQFDSGNLQRAGANSFRAADGVKASPASGEISQGKLEQSNVGAAESSVRLVSIMRQFEMLQRATNVGYELNRRAIEEVARVSA